MTEAKHFIAMILEQIDKGESTDDTRLVFCDWLDDRGECVLAAELRRPQVGPEILKNFHELIRYFRITPTLEFLQDCARNRRDRLAVACDLLSQPADLSQHAELANQLRQARRQIDNLTHLNQVLQQQITDLLRHRQVILPEVPWQETGKPIFSYLDGPVWTANQWTTGVSE